MNVCLRLGAVLLLLATASAAHALTVEQLQKMLQSATPGDARYEELRESPWLSAPVSTRGTLHVTAQSLEKRVESPRPETWRMLADRLEWAGPGGAHKQILFSQVPGLQALAEVTRHAVAGELVALQRDFTITLRGDQNVWTAQLQPRTTLVQRQLESVELQGTGGHLRVLIVNERRGDRTTTRILP
jgi:hypothetical protein